MSNLEPGNRVVLRRVRLVSWPPVGTRGRVICRRDPLVEIRWDGYDTFAVMFPEEVELVSAVDLIAELDG